MEVTKNSTVRIPHSEAKELKPMSTSDLIRHILKDPKFKGESGKDGLSIKGDKGKDGESATLRIGAIKTGPAGSEVSIVNTGSVRNAVLEITIPKGFDGKDGLTIKGDKGDQGDAATIQIESVKTGAPGSQVIVKNVGTITNVKLEITIPKGLDGKHGKHGDSIKGDPGKAATIKVGKTTTSEPGTEATVTNSGDQSNAVLNFTIPKGEKGDTGSVPDHEVKDDMIRFKKPDGTWGKWLIVGRGGDSETVYYPANVNKVLLDTDKDQFYKMQYDDQIILVVGTKPATIEFVDQPDNYLRKLTVKQFSTAEVKCVQAGGTVNNTAELILRARIETPPGDPNPDLGESSDFFSLGGQFWVK